MSDQPSQAFLDSEIGREIEDLVMHSYIAGSERRIFARHDESLAAIERLLINERRMVAEDCCALVLRHTEFMPKTTLLICRDILARFPAPKETPNG